VIVHLRPLHLPELEDSLEGAAVARTTTHVHVYRSLRSEAEQAHSRMSLTRSMCKDIYACEDGNTAAAILRTSR
jgi:hypothetical protein